MPLIGKNNFLEMSQSKVSFLNIDIELYYCSIDEDINQSGKRIGTHKHSFFEIIYPLEKDLVITFDKAEKTVSQGEFVLISPNVTHCIGDAYQKNSYVIIGFMPSPSDILLETDYFIGNTTSEMKMAVDGILRSENIEHLKVYITLLMIEMFTNKDIIDENKNALLNDHRIIATEAHEFILLNLSNSASAIDVARYVHLSTRQLDRIMLEQYNKTTSALIREKKIEKAKNLLKIPGFTIFEISEKCGYSSESSFSRAFFEATGETPAEYRKKYINK